MNYKSLYRSVGVTSLSKLSNPKIIKNVDFVFPLRSILYYVKADKVAQCPEPNIGLLSKTDEVAMKLATEYKDPIGNFKVLRSEDKKLYKEFKKKYLRDFKFVPLNTNKLKIQESMLLVNNYASLTAMHDYRNHLLKDYYVWYNTYKACFSNIGEFVGQSDRSIFVNIDIPKRINSISSLKRYNKEMSRAAMDEFNTYRHLNILDIYKFLYSDSRKDSLFDLIPKQYLKKVNLLFTFNDKVVLVNLALLYYSLNDTEDSELKLSKKSPDIVAKALLKMFDKLVVDDAISVNIVNDVKVEENNNIAKAGISDEFDVYDDDSKDIDAEVNDTEPNIVSPDLVSESDGIKEESVVTEEATDDDFNVEPIKIDTIKNLDIDSFTSLKNELAIRLENKEISNAEYKKMITMIQTREDSKDPFGEKGVTLKDRLTYKDDDVIIPDEDMILKDIPGVLDKSMLSNKINVIDSHYVANVFKKDLVNSIYGIQKSGIIIDDHTVKTIENNLEKSEEHTFTIKPLDGKPSTIKFVIPYVEEDSTYRVSGNQYRLRKQRADLPIRKIDSNKVALSSYYGKLFITKSDSKTNEFGFWFSKQLVNRSDEDKKIKNIILSNVDNVDVEAVQIYLKISKAVKSFSYGNMNFKFIAKERADYIKSKKLELGKIEENGKYTLVGEIKSKDNNTLLLLDDSGNVYEYGKKEPTTNLFDIINSSINNSPVEFATIKVIKEKLPLGLLLSYYLGLTNLLATLDVKFYHIESNKRHTLEEDEYLIRFKDKKLVVKRDFGLGDMIVGGLSKLGNKTKLYNFKNFNKKATVIDDTLIEQPNKEFKSMLRGMGYESLYITEMDLLRELFVDPITANILGLMKEPKLFIGLLIRSSELLLLDGYKNPNDISGMSIKGYERLAGLVYNQMVINIKDYRNKNVFSKSKVTNDVFAVQRRLMDDSTSILMDDINPIALLKQQEDVTYLGYGGRMKTTMAMSTRAYDKSEIGIISEATKDSGDVGISAYLSANPNIENARGFTGKFDFKDDGVSSLLSTSALLAPDAMKDDIKRVNFISIQNAHVIPIPNAVAPIIRTGYESILSNRLPDKYAYHAKDDGKVIDVKGNNIKIEYKDGTSKTLKLYVWYSKIENNSTFKHKVVTNLVKNQKFKKGDVITFDTAMFEEDFFNPGMVVYKNFLYMNTMLTEEDITDEDSTSISKKASQMLNVHTVKIKEKRLTFDDAIEDLVNIGKKVLPNDILFLIHNANLGSSLYFNEQSKETLKKLKNNTLKAKMSGIVEEIHIYYHGDEEDMNDNLREIIKSKKVKATKVGNEYSSKGKVLQKDHLEVKIYISTKEEMGTGDKGIYANQLKCTVGNVYNEIMTDANGNEIDGKFSNKSIAARGTVSPYNMGTTATLLYEMNKMVVDIYFKK